MEAFTPVCVADIGALKTNEQYFQERTQKNDNDAWESTWNDWLETWKKQKLGGDLDAKLEKRKKFYDDEKEKAGVSDWDDVAQWRWKSAVMALEFLVRTEYEYTIFEKEMEENKCFWYRNYQKIWKHENTKRLADGYYKTMDAKARYEFDEALKKE